MNHPALRRRTSHWDHVGSFAFLITAVAVAWITRSGWRIPGLRWIYRLSRFEAFHIAAHLGLFALVGFWAGRRGNERAVWLWTMGGGIAIELAQLGASGQPLTLLIMAASAFDLLVNFAGAGVGMAARRGLEICLPRSRI